MSLFYHSAARFAKPTQERGDKLSLLLAASLSSVAAI
jgi:hypothetical protein